MSRRLATLGAILVVSAAALLVLALSAGEAFVGLAVGGAPCDDRPAAPARHAPLPTAWTRAAAPPEAAPETSIWGAAWVRDRWIAVGFDAGDSDAASGVAWSSVDGTTWSATTPFGADSSAAAVIPVGSGAVAVGRYRSDAAAWHRARDTWQVALLASRPGPFASEAFVLDGDCGRLVAAGPEGDDLAPVTWTSTDALAWQRNELRRADVSSHAFGVAVTHEAQVIVGAGVRSDGGVGAMAWHATDGGDWRAVDLPGPAALASDVAATANGFVAVGWSSDPAEAVLWRSPDGLAWEVRDADAAFAAAPRRLELTSVEAWGDGFVVAGLRRSADGTRSRGLVWVARDGEVLQPIPAPAEATLIDEVVVGAEGMVLIGRFRDSEEGMGSPGTIWVGR